MTTRVAGIGGGENSEHEVSLASASAVVTALDPRRYDVVPLTIGRDGTWHHGGQAGGEPVGLGAAVRVLQSCDVVIPALHGLRGEDGTIAALCELAHVPHVGSGVRAGALGMDKWVTKLVAQGVGVATASGVLLTRATAAAYGWSGPVVVKPVSAGSSHGVSLVETPEALAPALDAALALDDRVLVEEVLVGREIDVAVLGHHDGTRVVAPALEIVGDGVFDLATKYDGSADFRVPAPLSDTQRTGLETTAVAVYDALGCGGVDFFLTRDGPVLNEVNTMPGFTPQSQVPRMFAAAGTSYPALLELLVSDALSGRSGERGNELRGCMDDVHRPARKRSRPSPR